MTDPSADSQLAESLPGLRVHVLRGGDWGASVAERIEELGGVPVITELLRIEAAADPAPLQVAADGWNRGAYDWLVLTSANGAEAFTAAGGAPRAGARVAAVGPATAEALERHGFAVDLMPSASFSAAGLAAAFAELFGVAGDEAGAGSPEARDATLLLPISEIADHSLENSLRELGHRVTRVTAYRTVTVPPERDPFGDVDPTDTLRAAVLVTSSSAARALAEHIDPLPNETLLAAIGDPTARTLHELGLHADVVATTHTIPGLLTALAQFVAAHPNRLTSALPAAPILPPYQRTTPMTHTDRSQAFTSAFAPAHPHARPRRLRSTPAMRRLVAETQVQAHQLILPMFVREGLQDPQPITSMPGVQQHTLDSLRRAATEAAEAGLGGVMLFGVPAVRDARGSGADDPDGILNVATRAVAAEVGDALVVQTDLCLDEFTDHGHCGVLDQRGAVDNDATLERYRSMALAQAEAGSALLGLSGMMDGQVAAVREALDAAGRTDTAILAYAAKYASAFYGPFREAVDSQLTGDRRSYQQDPANRREGRREARLDVAEGADVLMVKPAMSYLDVLADVAAESPVPVWAYQVSGEAAMIEAAAANGWIDRRRAIEETVISMRRAGADAVLSYFAVEIAGWLR